MAVIAYYFQIWKKREYNIISSRVISSHMGPMNIETLFKIYILQIVLQLNGVKFTWKRTSCSQELI